MTKTNNNVLQPTRNIAKKGICGMRSSSPASISFYLDSDFLRNPFQAILPTFGNNKKMRNLLIILFSFLSCTIIAQEKIEIIEQDDSELIDLWINKDIIEKFASNYIKKTIRNEIIHYYDSDIIRKYYSDKENIDKRNSNLYSELIYREHFYIDTSRINVHTSVDSLYYNNIKVDSIEIPIKFILKEYNYENRFILKYDRLKFKDIPSFGPLDLSFLPRYILRDDPSDFTTKEEAYKVAAVLGITNIDYNNIDLIYKNIEGDYFWRIPIYDNNSKTSGSFIQIPAQNGKLLFIQINNYCCNKGYTSGGVQSNLQAPCSLARAVTVDNESPTEPARCIPSTLATVIMISTCGE